MTEQAHGKKTLDQIQFSVLDLASVVEGGTTGDAFSNTLDLARHAEAWGYHRYWLAEHHNMPGVGSSATSVVMGYVAAGTHTIRVGSGGIMLPNHSPLVIAEQFGTLEAMYPGRIDLGLGRAPGSDQQTAMALRRDLSRNGQEFPELLKELRDYFDASIAYKRVRAYPGEGANIPIWLLGSSDFSAGLAAQLGLPFAFASHFSNQNTMAALSRYYREFTPSSVLSKPHTMVGINVYAADTQEEAEYIATSHYQQFLGLIRNRPTRLQPPISSMDGIWNEQEKAMLSSQVRSSIIGTPDVVKQQLQAFLDQTQADEMIVNAMIYDQKARLRSFEIVAEVTGIKS